MKLALVSLPLIVLLTPSPAPAQWSNDPLLNQVLRNQTGMRSFGDNLFGVFQSAAKVVDFKMQTQQSLGAARRKFFSLYPNGQGLQAAMAEYEQLLLAKDSYYFHQSVMNGRPDNAMMALNILTGGDIDRGIFPAAQPAFRKWVEDVRKNLGAAPGASLVISDALRIGPAINASWASYQAYAVRRYLEDFREAGKPPVPLNTVRQ